MDQIKSLITPSKFKVWVRHVESKTRDERDIDTTVGTSYLKGVWDEQEQAYRATKFYIHPEFKYMGLQVDLFKAALELLSSAHKKLISDDVITSSQRKHIDEVIQQGHVRKDLPFGAYLLDSPRRKTMSRIAKNPEIKRDRPKLTRNTEGFIWSLADALARALREPQGNQEGDARFSVSGMSTSSWSIKHPDLEILESGESPLILRIRKVGDGEWRVTGQNQLQNLKNTKVLSVEKTPPTPNHTWDLDFLSRKAAAYFLEQKNKIMGLKQSMAPAQAPGAGAEAAPPGGGMEGGGMGGGGMPPMASRRAQATLANLHKAQRIVAGLSRKYGSEGWFRDARVVNDRFGVGIAVRLRSLPGRRLRASLEGIPVYWQPGNRRMAGVMGSGYFVDPKGKIVDAGDLHADHMRNDPETYQGRDDPETMVEEGWIRARVLNKQFSIDARGGMSGDQLWALQKIAREYRSPDLIVSVLVNDYHRYEISCKEFLEMERPGEIKRGRRASAKPEGPKEESHEDLVNRVYKYILSRKRHFSSPKYLALKLRKDLGIKVSVPKLVKAIGELMAQDLIDFSARKFKPVIAPVKPKEDLVAIRNSQSLYRLDKGNWRHNDNLDSTMNTEILTQDAPEEKNNAYSRVMPDPTSPN
jgi:hypothetical protein